MPKGNRQVKKNLCADRAAWMRALTKQLNEQYGSLFDFGQDGKREILICRNGCYALDLFRDQGQEYRSRVSRFAVIADADAANVETFAGSLSGHDARQHCRQEDVEKTEDKMAKSIVFCADGTWDSSANGTNVYKLYKACLTTATQVPYYDDGVGSDGTPIEKLLGGAFGAGLFQKIKDGYSKIAQVYEAGDPIFLFGFSRGAFTARSLAGMIAVAGLPTKNFDDALVEAAFQAYRNKDQREKILAGLQAEYAMDDAKLTMVGVWDTVGSLGIPAIFGGVSPVVYGFLDLSLHPDVRNAYHALAIDERRAEFPASLWSGTTDPNQTLEQVWFTGVHCDVGGGYPEHGLSDIAFAWMLGKAVALGLQVAPAIAAQYALPDGKHSLDQLHESWSLLWGFPHRREIAETSNVSNSVQIRCTEDAGYRPGNLKLDGSQLEGTYQFVNVVSNPG